MKSKYASATVALTVMLAFGVINTAIAAANEYTPNRWGTTNPNRTVRSDAEKHAAMQRNAVRHRETFDPANPENPIPGKSYRDLTAADFQRLLREADVVIVSALFTYSKEYYDVVDSIKPTAMTRDQFLHVLLREAARRDILGQVLNITEFVPPAVANQNVTISRPLDVPPDQRTTAALPAADAVYRDVATTLLQHPRAVVVPMERDIANQIGFTNGGGALDIETDMEAFIIGYMAGSSPVFFNGRQAGRPAGRLPMTVGFNSNYSEAQVREAFCAVVPAISNPGRARGVYQNMAVSAGFLLARHDARDNFASNDARLGANGVLCPATPPVWNHTIMGPAITGIDLLPEQANNRR